MKTKKESKKTEEATISPVLNQTKFSQDIEVFQSEYTQLQGKDALKQVLEKKVGRPVKVLGTRYNPATGSTIYTVTGA